MTTQSHKDYRSLGNGYLPGLVGVEILTVSKEFVESRMMVRREVMAPNGFLHAASVTKVDVKSAPQLFCASLQYVSHGSPHGSSLAGPALAQ